MNEAAPFPLPMFVCPVAAAKEEQASQVGAPSSLLSGVSKANVGKKANRQRGRTTDYSAALGRGLGDGGGTGTRCISNSDRLPARLGRVPTLRFAVESAFRSRVQVGCQDFHSEIISADAADLPMFEHIRPDGIFTGLEESKVPESAQENERSAWMVEGKVTAVKCDVTVTLGIPRFPTASL
ncbi:hypothetical protein R3P38DRAFT_2795132 [Favolaschia claudopus]|uniref:Uncharacterized protein n=1 Tax=Favolaschia claudopus TaxID=2862362 RepID=A0AAW0A791_9AGAR